MIAFLTLFQFIFYIWKTWSIILKFTYSCHYHFTYLFINRGVFSPLPFTLSRLQTVIIQYFSRVLIVLNDGVNLILLHWFLIYIFFFKRIYNLCKKINYYEQMWFPRLILHEYVFRKLRLELIELVSTPFSLKFPVFICNISFSILYKFNKNFYKTSRQKKNPLLRYALLTVRVLVTYWYIVNHNIHVILYNSVSQILLLTEPLQRLEHLLELPFFSP